MALVVHDNVPLAPLTTFELGGPARHFVEAKSEETLRAALAFAADRGLPAFILGGGSNLVVADAGFPGVVVANRLRGRARAVEGSVVELSVAAGEPWDEIVAEAVQDGLAGLECLSGIPGLAGATPVQNVGAYGQEVADTVARVRVLDRARDRIETQPNEACGFAYRDSVFKQAPGSYVVLEVTFRLARGGAPQVRYAELQRALAGAPSPTLAAVRDTVLRLRRGKSMVLDPGDENRRSAGSFFTNPIVSDVDADALVARAVREGVVAEPDAVPRWPAGPGRTKLAAGWLIERAGITRGLRRGRVGVSSKHALALVHHGGGTTGELVALAREIRRAVHDRFGVTLAPEPVFLGDTGF